MLLSPQWQGKRYFRCCKPGSEALARRPQFRTQSEKILHRSDDAFAATLEGVEVVTQAETHQVGADELGSGQATA